MKTILELKDFSCYYSTSGRDDFCAVNSVSLKIMEGEILGLTGASGSGKSTLARAMMGMASSFTGSARYRGEDLYRRAWRKLSVRPVQMVFQDSKSSFNPRMTLFQSMEEPLLLSGVKEKGVRKENVAKICQMVGLNLETAMKRPGECSGGERQRANIARALMLKPELLILDEPVASLDASIQAQIINLLREISRRSKMSMVFISHDLELVRYLCDRILVMDESGKVRDKL